MSKLLLLSNSTMPGKPFLAWPKLYLEDFLSGTSGVGIFIPFAGVTISFDEYGDLVEHTFSKMGFSVKSIHRFMDYKKAIEEAAFVVVGGGNSFALLSRIYEHELLEIVRQKVLNGTPYVGWSAGSNLACPTIMTTNDMPIIQPPSLQALHLIPFQINPHYHELKFEGQGGETRRERLEEFLLMNPDKKVMALPEGMLLLQDEFSFVIKGKETAKLYEAGKSIKEYKGEDDLSFLMN